MKRSYYKQCNEDHNILVMRKSINGKPEFHLKIWDYLSWSKLNEKQRNPYWGVQKEMLITEAAGNGFENCLLLTSCYRAKIVIAFIHQAIKLGAHFRAPLSSCNSEWRLWFEAHGSYTNSMFMVWSQRRVFWKSRRHIQMVLQGMLVLPREHSFLHTDGQ